jgi:hypothetical protein
MVEATQKSAARRTSDKTRKNGASGGSAAAAPAGDIQPKTPSRKGAAAGQADQGSPKTSGKKRRKVNHGQCLPAVRFVANGSSVHLLQEIGKTDFGIPQRANHGAQSI